EASEDTVSIASSPNGATVSMQDYVTPDSAWHVVGATPVRNALIPHGYFRWKVSKAGVGEYVTAPMTDRAMHFPLDSALRAPPGMVYVSGNTWGDMIAFMGWVGPFRVPSFLMDRYEVTNREYQAFVDHGGYAQPRYWADAFMLHGHAVSRDSAMRLFRDRTGRPGPSTWDGGRYPAGRADYPVSGVSWYEASAYAAFVGKSLPAFAQWYLAAPPDVARFTVRLSNISRTDVAPVGAFKGLGPFGTFDMAGNVAEWTVNALSADRRFILGGDWRAQSYLYDDPDARAAFDRSPGNGIRCVRNIVPLPPAVSAPIKALERDFATVTPASDAVFAAYRHLYAYERTPLNARVDSTVENARDWRKERITLDAAYAGERLALYLFIPKNVKPPYQTVVFFPSARVLHLTNSRSLGDTAYFDYVVQSGRAVLYPVYQDTYERRFRRGLPGANQEVDLSIQRSRDLGRSLDYLDTRSDIAHDKIAYLGVSMGSAEGVIYATLAQDRLATAVFLDGGYFLGKAPPGGDQADFAPRMKKPVLMVNGRYDFTFPYEKSQLPLFRMLGTPDSSKRHVVLETPHDVLALRPALVSAVLGWLDRYLGPIR
ncbi:MAG: SUMF1/EgtB/PvdO family nonheme iron enzyme, partial [bacterium]